MGNEELRKIFRTENLIFRSPYTYIVFRSFRVVNGESCIF